MPLIDETTSAKPIPIQRLSEALDVARTLGMRRK
jgi:hypothetical protein